jgi:hypothetical protein
MFDEIEKVLNSYQEFSLGTTTRLKITTAYFPAAGGALKSFECFQRRTIVDLPFVVK